MANFRKTIATARAKVAKAEIEAFNARLEAVARPTRTNSRRSFCGCWATASPSGRSRRRPRLAGTTKRTRRCTEETS